MPQVLAHDKAADEMVQGVFATEWPLVASTDHAVTTSRHQLSGLSLSTVAHDLRAPIAALTVSSELLVDEASGLDQGQLSDRLRGIHRRALWLQDLVENLLCASSINEGRMGFQPYVVDFLELVMEVETVVQPLLEQKRQVLAIGVRDVAITHLMGDRRRLGQVLVNLILNASKFGPCDMTISLSLSQPRAGEIICTVADRGPGLPDCPVEQLFQPFYQGSGNSSPGVGLGLAIVRSIVEAHGGRVGARSRRGGGAEFWFALPLAPKDSTQEE